MAEEFSGFANTVNAKGKSVNARKVAAYEDESEAGQIRLTSQTTPSSIVGFHSDDKATDGAPAAVVPAPDDEAKASDGDEAEGEGANGS